jgi:phage terminase large subunit-like protein
MTKRSFLREEDPRGRMADATVDRRDQIQKKLDTLDEATKKEFLDRIQRNPFLTYQPHPAQEKFHKSNARVRAFFGGNRSGKTRALIQEVVWWATGLHPWKKTPKPADIWVVSLDFPSSRDVVQPMIRKILGSGYLKSWRETDKIIELTNGSTISFKSVDSGWEKFQGTEKHLIAFDEEPSHMVYQECVMRVVSTKGDIIIAMTPLHGMTWIYDEIYEPWKMGVQKDAECFVARTRDNPYVDVKEIQKIERSFYDEEREARLEGSFVEFAGLIYKDFDPRIHIIKRFPIPQHWVKVRGIDPGLNNPTGCVWWAVSHENEHFIYDEFYQEGMTIKDLAMAIRVQSGADNIAYSVIDPAACSRNPSHPELRSVRDEYAKYGIWTKPANNDVSYGINCIKELLHINPRSGRPRLFIFSDLVNIRKEIVRYRWDTFRHHPEEKNPKEKPKKVMDHLMDAARYVAASSPRYVSSMESADIARMSVKLTRS